MSELQLPGVENGKKLVLLGELTADDTLNIRLGQSTPVAQGSTLQVLNPAGIAAVFSRENGVISTLLPQTDDRTASLRTLLFSSPQKLFSGSTYTLDVVGGNYPNVKATVRIPSPFVAAVIDTATLSYAGGKALRLLLRIYDPPGETNFYSVEALRQSFGLSGSFQYGGGTYDLVRDRDLYDSLKTAGISPPREVDTNYSPIYERLALYTDDEVTENLKLATPYTEAKRVLLNDVTFSGGRHDVQVFVSKERFSGTFPNDFGRILFSIKSLTPEYFSYLRAYETFTPATSTGYLAQPVKIPSNVIGGLGIVGGAFRVPFYFFFDKNPL